MARFPINYRQASNQRIINPQHKRTKLRFRWGFVLIPMICLSAAWIINHVNPAFTWRDLLDLLPVSRRHYSRLAILGLTLIGFLSIKRILQNDNKE